MSASSFSLHRRNLLGDAANLQNARHHFAITVAYRERRPVARPERTGPPDVCDVSVRFVSSGLRPELDASAPATLRPDPRDPSR